MVGLPSKELPLIDPQTGKISLEWYSALQLIAAGSLPKGVYAGTGAPTFVAPKNAIYVRADGSSSTTRLYINTNGSTGWTSITTAT